MILTVGAHFVCNPMENHSAWPPVSHLHGTSRVRTQFFSFVHFYVLEIYICDVGNALLYAESGNAKIKILTLPKL